MQKRGGWGHSSIDQAMQLAEMAGVKRLAQTHHAPAHDDEFLERIEKLCQERFPNAVLAREGMEISIGEAACAANRRRQLSSSPLALEKRGIPAAPYDRSISHHDRRARFDHVLHLRRK